jgi:hypothetical protein
MKSNPRAVRWLVLGVAVTLSACDSVDRLSDVETAPAYSTGAVNGSQMQQLLKLHTPAIGETGSMTVNSQGGTLIVGGHMLYVPAKTVDKTTLFIMTVMPGDYIHVDLKAFKRDGTPVTTFTTPVWLGLSYAGAPGDSDRPLTVTYLVDGTIDGRTQSITSIMYSQWHMVFAQLTHFSSYSAAID